MRYIGSKTSTLPELSRLITSWVSEGTFCDCFGGLGTVGSHFKQKGFKVHTGDILRFAHYFQIARIERQKLPYVKRLRHKYGWEHSSGLVEHLNGCQQKEGWFVEEYSLKRKFFTIENARKIEGCRTAIAGWLNTGVISAEEHAVLTASLINSMDKVANTAGTYYAFLKTWHRKALQKFRFDFVQGTKGPAGCKCKNVCALDLVKSRAFDVLYLDPPYNERSYAHYYHLPETIAQGGVCEVKGLSGIPDKKIPRSEFNDPKAAASALERIVRAAKFKLLAFQYSDEGVISPQQTREILKRYGRLEEHIIISRGYTTNSVRRATAHRLYLLHNA